MTGRVDDETAAAVFESTAPPDGERHEGADAVRVAFEAFFATSSPGAFTAEELVVTGDRAILRWPYTWDPAADGHVRRVDVYTVRRGLVAEKLAHVKG